MRIAVFLLLAIYGGISLSAGCHNALRVDGSQDFAPIYKAARLWWYGHNPYAGYSDVEWQAAAQSPPMRQLPVVIAYSTPYPPLALINTFFSGFTSWTTAKYIWLALNLSFAACVPLLLRWLWYRHWTVAEMSLMVAVWAGGLGLRVGLGNGQHNLIWLVCTLSALAALKSERLSLASLSLALSFHKMHLAGMFLTLLAAKRRWRVLAGVVASGVLLLAVFLNHVSAPAAEIWRSYLAEMNSWTQRLEAGGLEGMGATHLYPLVKAMLGRGLGTPFFYILTAAALALSLSLAHRNQERCASDLEVASIMLLTLWAMYSAIYSAIVLIVPIAALYDRLRNRRPPLLLLASEAVLLTIWYIHPSKLKGSFTGAPHLLETSVDISLDAAYRLFVFGVFIVVSLIQLTAPTSGQSDASDEGR